MKPLFYAVVCLHWFNPLAWLALRAFEHDMEAACDEAAVQGCTLAERSTYCESLLQFAMQGRPIRTPGSLAFGQGSVKERIVHLLRLPPSGCGGAGALRRGRGRQRDSLYGAPAGGGSPRRAGAARRHCRDCSADTDTCAHGDARSHARCDAADVK
ncbi:MAG: M56 family metallopeptidase [Gemmiger formicilis]